MKVLITWWRFLPGAEFQPGLKMFIPGWKAQKVHVITAKFQPRLKREFEQAHWRNIQRNKMAVMEKMCLNPGWNSPCNCNKISARTEIRHVITPSVSSGHIAQQLDACLWCHTDYSHYFPWIMRIGKCLIVSTKIGPNDTSSWDCLLQPISMFLESSISRQGKKLNFLMNTRFILNVTVAKSSLLLHSSCMKVQLEKESCRNLQLGKFHHQ